MELFSDKWIEKAAALLEANWPSPGLNGAAAPSLPGVSAAIAVLSAAHKWPERDIIAVTAGPDEAEALFSDIRTIQRFIRNRDAESSLCREPLLLYPPEAGDDIEREGMRLAVAKEIFSGKSSGSGRILVTAATALLSPMPSPDAVEEAGRLMKCGGEDIPFESLPEVLTQSGYSRESIVAAKGQIAVRGGLIDIWPPTSPLPVRIDFFGDTVEAIRFFDPVSQRSGENTGEIWIPPCEMKGLESSAPAEVISAGALFFWLEHDRISGMTRRPDDQSPTLEAWTELLERVASQGPFRQIFTGDPPPAGMATFSHGAAPAPAVEADSDIAGGEDFRSEQRRKLITGLSARAHYGEETVFLIDTPGGIEWLSTDIPEDSGIRLEQGIISSGCEWKELNLVILGQSDIYAVKKRSSRRMISPAVAYRGGRIEKSGELKPGDYVVHIDHGIGKFEGVREIEHNGRREEVMTILYADGAKLHVPVSHAHLLSRYIGVAGHPVTLHKLGGVKWKQDCIKTEKAIVDFAARLLDLQARRNARPGYAYDISLPWIASFESAFPFRETDDQVKCIAAVKEDMASPRPMDRLICGDAGYGKTEIAMRAAFIAATNGKQVAVLAPTTVLAEQHYATFRDRMAAFPIRIEVLSRLRSSGYRSRILGDTARGGVDILIGTHSLLQPAIRFKDIGLVIIDEEQRFGVDHKERLKQLRATVDVLTLSATPIPRTLYMSMTGARDMSLLQTPPQERLAITTKVERDRDEIIRSAVLAEINREGQVFFLHNRVLTMEVMHNRLRRLLPEVSIGVAHGQMPTAELSETMKRFEAGEFQMLLCTTIVESGLDIPRANTIIIHRADRFGLAELYQLRGRVGRSSKRGFAYLLIPPQGVLEEDARQRIKALQRHGGLSGGLNLALRDLEIRGAGNILGAEQSGHIASVGFGLYCQLLKRTVARMKGEEPPPIVDTALDIDFITLSPNETDEETSSCIPYRYIDDETLRMAFHRRIAEAGTVADIRSLRAEMEERFGAPPPETRRMLRMAELRILASAAGIKRIEVKDGAVRMVRRDGTQITAGRGILPKISGKNSDSKLASLFRLLPKK